MHSFSLAAACCMKADFALRTVLDGRRPCTCSLSVSSRSPHSKSGPPERASSRGGGRWRRGGDNGHAGPRLLQAEERKLPLRARREARGRTNFGRSERGAALELHVTQRARRRRDTPEDSALLDRERRERRGRRWWATSRGLRRAAGGGALRRRARQRAGASEVAERTPLVVGVLVAAALARAATDAPPVVRLARGGGANGAAAACVAKCVTRAQRRSTTAWGV